jgi:hypothetical protein
MSAIAFTEASYRILIWFSSSSKDTTDFYSTNENISCISVPLVDVVVALAYITLLGPRNIQQYKEMND